MTKISPPNIGKGRPSYDSTAPPALWRPHQGGSSLCLCPGSFLLTHLDTPSLPEPSKRFHCSKPQSPPTSSMHPHHHHPVLCRGKQGLGSLMTMIVRAILWTYLVPPLPPPALADCLSDGLEDLVRAAGVVPFIQCLGAGAQDVFAVFLFGTMSVQVFNFAPW